MATHGKWGLKSVIHFIVCVGVTCFSCVVWNRIPLISFFFVPSPLPHILLSLSIDDNEHDELYKLLCLLATGERCENAGTTHTNGPLTAGIRVS